MIEIDCHSKRGWVTVTEAVNRQSSCSRTVNDELGEIMKCMRGTPLKSPSFVTWKGKLPPIGDYIERMSVSLRKYFIYIGGR